MKHLLKAASLGKKFSDPAELDPNEYVDIVKFHTVLIKLRNSRFLPRLLTWTQMKQFKARQIIKLLLKYRDYQNAIALVDLLDKKKYLSMIYEEWCSTFLRTCAVTDEQEIIDRFRSKFA